MANESLPLSNHSVQRNRKSRAPWGKKYSQPCSVDGCDRLFYGRDLCSKHYKRLLSSGDPLIVRKYHPAKNTPKMFWDRVDKSPGLGPRGDCWEWRGAVAHTGYGRFTMDYRDWITSRLAWFLTYGAEPKRWILHSCDNPLCVNVAHLREGDVRDNTQDMVDRNRQARGERSGQAVLTEWQVIEIKHCLKAGLRPAQIGRIFGVPRPTIVSIQIGRNWRHVEI